MYNASIPVHLNFQGKSRLVKPPVRQTTTPAAEPIRHPLTQPESISPAYYQAQVAPQLKAATIPKFGGHQLVERDYLVTPDPDSTLNSYMASKTLRALMFRDLYKKQEGDPSHLKMKLNLSSGLANRGELALADSLLLLEKPTDIVVDGNAGPASIPTLMMTRIASNMRNETARSTSTGGKTFMGRYANITMGPVAMYMGGDNHNIQIRREESNEDFQMRVALVMLATGEKNRSKVIEDLSGSQEFNALQALAYGEHGLVDAILIGEDQVLTRAGLNAFYKAKGWNEEQIETFNEDDLNLDDIIKNPSAKAYLKSLSEYSPASVVPEEVLDGEERPEHYFFFNDVLKKKPVKTEVVPVDKPEKDEDDSSSKKIVPSCEKPTKEVSVPVDTSGRTSPTKSVDKKKKGLQVGVRLMESQDFKSYGKSKFLNTSVNGLSDKPQHVQIQGEEPSNGLIYDDTIFFNDGFDLETSGEIIDSLRALKSKKLREENPSNIKIMLNSPGGQTRAAVELTNELDSMGRIKTDVIVNGLAASCGAWLLASATGNKLATPQSRIMIHQPSVSYISGSTNTLGNQEADNMNSLYKHIAGVIARTTGRDRKKVEKDLNQDTWMNPLEAMFYGDTKAGKGLLDGIVVGPNRAITRDEVIDYLKKDEHSQAFLTEKFGADDNVDKYLEYRLRLLRQPKSQWKSIDERDPFNDPVRTVMHVAASRGKEIGDISQLSGSATRTWTSDEPHAMDQFLIGRARELPADYWASASQGHPLPMPGMMPPMYLTQPMSQPIYVAQRPLQFVY